MLTGAVCDANLTIRLYLGEIQKENLIMLSLMTKLHTRLTDLKTFYQDRSGATAIEYGLIAAGIAVAIIAAAPGWGPGWGPDGGHSGATKGYKFWILGPMTHDLSPVSNTQLPLPPSELV